MQIPNETSPDEGLVDQASGMAQDAASAAQEKASELRDQGSEGLREQFDQRSAAAGAQARSLAEALRRSGSELSTQGNDGAAKLTGQAAHGIERFGIYLEHKHGDEVMRDIETFARRQPWLLAGLGVLAGATAARFMKASSARRSDGLPTGEQASRPELRGPAARQPTASVS